MEEYLTLLEPTKPSIDPIADIEAEFKRRYQLLMLAENNPRIQEALLELFKKSPWYFVTSMIYVNRPDLAAYGYTGGIAPFLAWECHKEIVDIYLGLNGWKTKSGALYSMAIYKSRAMGGSVVLLAAALWFWLFQPNCTQYLISLKQKAVDNNSAAFDSCLFGKLRFFIQHLPKWLRPSAWQNDDKPRKYDRMMILENSDNNSVFIGSSTTCDAERGSRGIRVIVDEANSIPYLGELLSSLTKVGPLVMLSSVKGNSSTFARYCNGQIAQIAEHKGDTGIVVKKLHYSQRPDWNQGTDTGRKRIADLKAIDDPSIWDSEMECNFNANIIDSPKVFKIPGDVICDDEAFDRVRKNTNNMTLGSFDFGQSISLTSWAHAWYDKKTDTLYLDDYFNFTDETCDIIKSKIYAVDKLIGDGATGAGPKTVNGVARTNAKNWFNNLSDVGVNVERVTKKSDQAFIDFFQKKLNEGKIRITRHGATFKKSPKHPTLLEALQNYCWDLAPGTIPENLSKENVKPKKNMYSHLADACQLIAWYVWKKM